NPQMGALMSMIIQPRHAKLGLAAQAENWPLAGYYFKELKTGFGVVGRAIPRWKGLPIPDLIEASVEPTFAVLDFAIKAGEPRQFAESYGKLTQACNNCHATTDHPFIAIKPPDASAWPNMEFKPGRQVRFSRCRKRSVRPGLTSGLAASRSIHRDADLADHLAVLLVVGLHQRVEFLERGDVG